MLEGRNVLALIEPIGFETSSLREVALFAPYTAMVHISGISVPGVALDAAQDAHRVSVDARDRCGTIEQTSALHAAGYSGPFSFECTEPARWQDPRLAEKIGRSFDYIEEQITVRGHA